MTKITSIYRMEELHPKSTSTSAGAVSDDLAGSDASSSASTTSANSLPGLEFERRQMPMVVMADHKITMVIDLRPRGLSYDHNILRARELDDFAAKYTLLTPAERIASLRCSRADFCSVLSQSVPCVGCRRSVEHLYEQLAASGHPTLEPVQITTDGWLTVAAADQAKPAVVAALLHRPQSLLTALLDQQPRHKKSSRCALHSLDSFRQRPFSDVWREVWACMRPECREEMTQISTADLHRTLEAYLKKHKFCAECRTKVERAYGLLLTDRNPNKEKGYVAALYANIKRCVPNKHIHLRTKVEFLDGLIRRAEPELNGAHGTRHRERHAKTLEIAQEEVLTCIGMFIYERLRRVHLCLKEEENAVQVLAAVSAHTLCRSFDTAVEKKRGISNLELLYQEISRAEKVKKARQELKKLKKKLKRKQVQQQKLTVGEDGEEDDEEEEEEEDGDEDEEEDEEEEEEEADDSIATETTCPKCNHATAISGRPETSSSKSPSQLSVNRMAQKCQCEKGKAFAQLNYTDDAYIEATDGLDDVDADGDDSVACACVEVKTSKTNKKKATKSTSAAPSKDTRTKKTTPAAAATGRNCKPAGTSSTDAGYGSASLHSSLVSSPEGSEVACSDGCCNHDHGGGSHAEDSTSLMSSLAVSSPSSAHRNRREPQLTLEQMLNDSTDSDSEHSAGDPPHIPDAVLLDFADRQQNIRALRAKLRADLRLRFNAMCQSSKSRAPPMA